MLKAAPLPTHELAESSGEGLRTPPRVPAPSLLAPTEMSYDWLFGIAAQPMLIVDAHNCIVRANVAAARLLRTSPTRLVGNPLTAAFAAASTRGLAAALSTARVTGTASTVGAPAGAAGAPLNCALSLVVAERHAYILVHLAEGRGHEAGAASVVEEAIENSASAFLLSDAHLQVEYANRAFLQLVEVDSLTEIHRVSLRRWLGLSGDDLAQMQEQMSARRAVSVLFLRLAPEHSPALDVEVSVVAVPHGDTARWGFSIRRRPRPS